MAHVLDHLTNLFIAQLIGKRRHVRLPVMQNLMEIGVAPLLHFLRAKVGCLQLFAKRSLSAAIDAVAQNTLGFECTFTAPGLFTFLGNE